MVTVKVALRLDGLDLRRIESYELVPEDLAELSFQSNGGVSTAVVYSVSPAPAVEALTWAGRIGQRIPSARVAGVHDELVSVSDIAARCAVGAEAVRLWTTGKRRATIRPFPGPRQVVGSGSKSMAIYAWREVLSWVRDVIGIDPDEGIAYLDDAQLTWLDARIAAQNARDGAIDRWTRLALSPDGGPVVMARDNTPSSTTVGATVIAMSARLSRTVVATRPTPRQTA